MTLGIFDSGVGGLTVVNEIKSKNSTSDGNQNYNIIYIGDVGRAPYGSKSEFEIKYYSAQIINKLRSLGATHFISACNSISVSLTTEMLDELGIDKNHWIDMVSATGNHFQNNKNKKVLVVATQATINSEVYKSVFDNQYLGLALPLLAGQIESAVEKLEIKNYIRSQIKTYLDSKNININELGYVFLGCTHYPLVVDTFKSIINSYNNEFSNIDIDIIDPAVYVARDVDLIFNNKLDLPEQSKTEHLNNNIFYTTRESETFKKYISSLGLSDARHCKVIDL